MNRLLTIILSIVLANAMVNAKLTIAYLNGIYEDEMPLQFCAKIRQALIDTSGEEWFKRFTLELKTQKGLLMTISVGRDKNLILEADSSWDEESMLKFKDALDYMACRGDTLVYCYMGSASPSSTGIFDILDDKMPRKLIVGEPLKCDLEYLKMYFVILPLNLGDDYVKSCEENDCRPLNVLKIKYDEDWDKFDSKDIDFFYDFIVKRDRKILSRPILSEPKYTDFSYDYDKRAGVRYLDEIWINPNSLPDIGRGQIPIDPLEIPIDLSVDEILNEIN